MQTWKQREGCNATHTTLIAAFESARYKEYADFVTRLAVASNIKISTDDLCDDNYHQSPSASPMEAQEFVQSLFLTDVPDDNQEGCIWQLL